ncbi:VOC family protein [Anaeromyxobacter paludicola]|uniref:Glyoxalase n=1 Tax=Anaeromyxobacter paludicola TaxID=2918171 RepID=A0ABM7XFL2_9BACT|nr:VOC family protein [Anaeromyxobacter paludicola]BDG10690.1 glyoxalase [Anaeromyxobacter paludicola]
MIDHITLKVRDFAKGKAFYQQALGPLGYTVIADFPEAAGMGVGRKPDFWLAAGEPAPGGLHLAFATEDRAQVDAFHAAALAAGATDNGKPGLRPDYHPNYYAAFVKDADGNNVEAVCHKRE